MIHPPTPAPDLPGGVTFSPTPYPPAVSPLIAGIDPLPPALAWMLAYHGLEEMRPPARHPILAHWAQVTAGGQLAGIFTTDAVAWCGLIMARCIEQTHGLNHLPRTPSWALSWAQVGTPVAARDTRPGDIVVLKRPLPNGSEAGHVALYVAEGPARSGTWWLAGGNQSNRVSVVQYATGPSRWVATRRLPGK